MALYSQDIDTVIEYTHPSLVDFMGGMGKAKETLTKTLNEIVTNGMTVKELTFPSDPVFFEGENNSFVFVPTFTSYSVNRQKIESLNFQLGVKSKEGSLQWYYFGGGNPLVFFHCLMKITPTSSSGSNAA